MAQKLREAQRKSKLAKKKDYYKILEVGRDATDTEIKKSYRKLALLWHPDKVKDKDEETKVYIINKIDFGLIKIQRYCRSICCSI